MGENSQPLNTDARQGENCYYQFGAFCLDTAERQLLREGCEIPLTPRAYAVLSMLVKHSGHTLTKEDFMREVWADSLVEEKNLADNISILRQLLGDDAKSQKYIKTVPRRGYRFVAEVTQVLDEDDDLIIEERTRAHAVIEETTEPEPQRGYRFVDELAESTPTVLQPRAESAVTRTRITRWLVPAAAVLLLLLVTTGWFLYSRGLSSRRPNTAPAQSIRSIAVMPFVNESGNDDVEYLSDGMTETLINSLSEVPSLNVKSRPAVFKYKGRDVAYPALASELNVQALLFGRLTLRGSDLTLFLSLIDPQTENQIWGKQYVRKLSDLVALQSDIGRDVAQSLQAKLTAAAEEGLTRNYSKKGEAYRLYLLGDYYWAKFTEENFLKAKKHYEDAIAIDPNYALAYTGVSNTYSVLGVNGHMPVAEARPKSRAAAQRAIELDPRLAEARLSLGAYKMFFEWDLDGAEAEYSRAMELDADYAVPHELMAYALRARGRHEEAIAEAKRAIELDPLNLLMLGDLGVCYRFSGQVERAIEINNRLIEMDPSFGDVRFENALAHSQIGNHDVALQELMKGLALTGNSTKVKAGLGIVYARMGNNAGATKVINELLAEAKKVYVSPMDVALIYISMNDKDKALAWLEKAYEERSPWLFEMNVTPELYPLRDDPRFQNLVKRLGV